MARPDSQSPQPNRKPRTTVPVASRSVEAELQARKPRPGRNALLNLGQRGKGSSLGTGAKLTMPGYLAVGVTTIMFLIAVSVPLNNFYQGRAEIVRLNAAISSKMEQKEQLLTQIERYRSDSYIEQEARRRLGVVAPGETAYRILDPLMSPDSATTTDKGNIVDDRQWYSVLWDSVAVEPTGQQTAVPQVQPDPAAPVDVQQ